MPQEVLGEGPEDHNNIREKRDEGYSPQDSRELAADLVRRSRTGDEQAFTLIVNSYGALLLRTAYLLLGDDEVAKDVVQEAFILAWKNMGQLREPTFLRAWLIKIVVNQATSMKRQLARKAALLREQLTQQYIDVSIHTADIQRGSLEDTLDLERAVGQLPMKQRVVLILFYYHRMTMPEIANMLEVSENTLRKRLQSALEKVRRALLEDFIPPENVRFSQESVNPHTTIHGEGAR